MTLVFEQWLSTNFTRDQQGLYSHKINPTALYTGERLREMFERKAKW